MSSFNPEKQENKIENKIVVALERISEAFRVLLWNESKNNALSPIQIQILIFLLFHSEDKCRASYLAAEFNMTKATISDSLKVLRSKQLIKKSGDELDTRSYTISLTVEGRRVAKQASSFTSSIERPLNKFSFEQKSAILDGLLKLISELNKTGVISIQRMCFTCRNYQSDNGIHYCKLLQSTLAASQLRIDCPEHELIA